MRRGKIVVIGAGSASFGLTNLGAILRTPELHKSELCLCDTNEEGLFEITALAQRINREWGADMEIRAETDRRKLLAGADFVIISVAVDRETCWRKDQEIGKKYGIIHYAENGGPGGFFHGARNIALLMPVLRDIEELAPDALVLNFTNPMTRICTAALKYTKVKMAGICHQLDFGYMMAGRLLGKDLGLAINHDYRFTWNHDPDEKRIAAAAHERLDILAAGINHFTWFLSIRDKQTGEELLPFFKRRFLEQKDFEPYTRAVLETFGECPTSGDAHFLEYMPYTGSMARGGWERYRIQMYPFAKREQERDALWEKIRRIAKGEESLEALKQGYSERAELMMAAVLSGSNRYDYAINLPNVSGYIENMPKNAVVEVPAVVGPHGITGVAVGELPPVAASFCRRQADISDLAVVAAVEGDKGLALQALALDPMIDDLDVAKAILKDGLAAFREYLPQFNGGDAL